MTKGLLLFVERHAVVGILSGKLRRVQGNPRGASWDLSQAAGLLAAGGSGGDSGPWGKAQQVSDL